MEQAKNNFRQWRAAKDANNEKGPVTSRPFQIIEKRID
jgi:hypothetical protein